MKSRSSTGVGMKVDLDYNIETMRITDSGAEESTDTVRRPMTIMDQIKSSSRVVDTTASVDLDTGEIKAELSNNKLKNMLAGIKAQAKTQ